MLSWVWKHTLFLELYLHFSSLVSPPLLLLLLLRSIGGRVWPCSRVLPVDREFSAPVAYLGGSDSEDLWSPQRQSWLTQTKNSLTHLLVLPRLRCYPQFISTGHSSPADQDSPECSTLTFLLPFNAFMGQVIIFGNLPTCTNWGRTTSQWGRGTKRFPSANHGRSGYVPDHHITMFSQSAAAESL